MSIDLSPQAASYLDVAPMTARDMIAAGAFVIDVREPDEYAAGHIDGARLIPLGSLCDHIASLPKIGDILIVCRSGRRSALACQEIGCADGRTLYNLAGGMLAWERVGLPVF